MQLPPLAGKRPLAWLLPAHGEKAAAATVARLAISLASIVRMERQGNTHMVEHDEPIDGREPRKNPRQPIFRDHNCWACNNGEKPCREGNYGCCSYPHARND